MRISELLQNGKYILVKMQASNGEELFTEALKLFNLDKSKSKNYLKALIEREEACSTGIGNEVAIPHIRSKKETIFKIAIGILKDPIDFKDPSGCKTKLFFLTISPSNQGEAHLSLLSHISVICKDLELIEKIKNSDSPDEVFKLILEKEKSLKKLKEEMEGDEGKIKKYQLLIITLYREEFLGDILSILYEFDLKKTNVLEGRELKSFMASNVPIYQGFRDMMKEDERENKTIISVVEEEKIFRISTMIEKTCQGFNREEDGFVISLPINFHIGV